MKVLCLGGAGKICRESTLDLVQFSDFDEITIGDYDEKAGREVVKWLNDPGSISRRSMSRTRRRRLRS